MAVILDEGTCIREGHLRPAQNSSTKVCYDLMSQIMIMISFGINLSVRLVI